MDMNININEQGIEIENLNHVLDNDMFLKVKKYLSENGLKVTNEHYIISNRIGDFVIWRHNILRADESVEVFLHKNDNPEYLNHYKFTSEKSNILRHMILAYESHKNKETIEKNNLKLKEYINQI